jgi:hypothetical protein
MKRIMGAAALAVVVASVMLLHSRGPRHIEDVPLARQLLDAPMPEGEQLKTVAKKFYALGFSTEGDRVLNYPEAIALQPLLGKGASSATTVRDALTMPETSDQGLQQLRDSLLDHGISASVVDATGQELPDLKLAIESYSLGTHPTTPEQVQGALWRTEVTGNANSHAVRALWLVTLSVTQHMGRPVQLWLGLRGVGASFLSCRTSVLAPDQATLVVCADYAGTLPNGRSAGQEIRALATAGGALNVQSVVVADARGYNLVTVMRGTDESRRQARKVVASAAGAQLAYVSCRQRADCPRTFAAIAINPGSIGFLLVAAGMIWAVRWRWRSQHEEDRSNPFKPVFFVYLALVLLAIPIDLLDSRVMQGGEQLFTGLFSTAYNMLLAMPWMGFRMQQISHASGAALIGGPEVDLVLSWIFMLANLVWLWCMANPPQVSLRQ